MAHEKQPDIGRKIYEMKHWGKGGAISDGRIRYELSNRYPSDKIPWMSTLYSVFTHEYLNAKKGNPLALARCLWCLMHLAPLSSFFKEYLGQEGVKEHISADQCDVVARILYRWSYVPLVRPGYVASARAYALVGRDKATQQPSGGPTWANLSMTLAQINLDLEEAALVGLYLAEAIEQAPGIVSANQRSRVLRDIALFLPKVSADTERVREFMDAADAVPGIDPDVRFKNVAARRQLGL